MARLKDKIASTPIARASELRDLLQGDVKPQNTPAIFVLLGRADATVRDSAAQITVQFVVVIVTCDVSDIRSGIARDPAGALAARVIKAIQGWRPCDGFDHLRLSGMDTPAFPQGYFFLPLIFTTNTFVAGDNNE